MLNIRPLNTFNEHILCLIVIYFVILLSAPSAPPQRVEVVATGQRSVGVTFLPPPETDWNSERIYGYKVEYRTAVNSAPLGTVVHNTSSTGTITVNIVDLLPYQEYVTLHFVFPLISNSKCNRI